MLLAELEIRHSRAVAPTRRVALGPHWLPTDPAPGYGGILLGGIVAAHLGDVDPELRDEFLALVDDLEAGRTHPPAPAAPPVPDRRRRPRPQPPQARRASGDDASATCASSSEGHGRPVPQLLGAVYAAGRLHADARPARVRRHPQGGAVGGRPRPRADRPTCPTSPACRPTSWRRFATDERWAREVLGFGPDERSPDRDEVQSAASGSLLRESHPDHGAEHEGAGQRILELTEARRILLP